MKLECLARLREYILLLLYHVMTGRRFTESACVIVATNQLLGGRHVDADSGVDFGEAKEKMAIHMLLWK